MREPRPDFFFFFFQFQNSRRASLPFLYIESPPPGGYDPIQRELHWPSEHSAHWKAKHRVVGDPFKTTRCHY